MTLESLRQDPYAKALACLNEMAEGYKIDADAMLNGGDLNIIEWMESARLYNVALTGALTIEAAMDEAEREVLSFGSGLRPISG